MKPLYFFLLFNVLFLTACLKEGEGGQAKIEGYIKINLFDEVTQDLLTSYLAEDERVYIIYGDAEFYGDDTRTSFNGKYEFDFLTQGDYTIFAYSECLFNLIDCPSKSEEVKLSTQISERKATVLLDTLVINKYQ